LEIECIRARIKTIYGIRVEKTNRLWAKNMKIFLAREPSIATKFTKEP